ncbi:MAG: rubrerythrin [Phycisphaeraceae bacterium]|nr:rubrerythrin [Phycisphaeraceae bacterium]
MPATETANAAIIGALTDAYWGEIETVMNYIANAEHLDGFRAKHIKTSLGADVMEEIGHAQLLARRIKTLGGAVPGSMGFKPGQTTLQPPRETTDVIAVVKGVIDAERSAIQTYSRVIEACDGVDPVTEDLAITIMGDEQEHLREFEGFLKELKAMSL